MVRVPGCGPGGRRFDPDHPPHFLFKILYCIGVSSSGKTQHFDCCIRRFESCHPSQKQQMHFCICCFLFSFLAGFEPIVHLLRSKRDIKIVASDKACLVGFCHPSHVVASYISLAAIFLSPRTHSAAPPFRNRSRSSRRFGCKRPHNGFVSLPPCFGRGGISKFDLCLFI